MEFLNNYNLHNASDSKQAFTIDKGDIPTDKSARKAYAFTLAEVLITLGIIGIVAAMTLPGVMGKFREKATVTKLKKFYSVLSQGYIFATEEFGTPDVWGISRRDAGSSDEDEEVYNASNAILIRDRLFKNIKMIQKCDNAKNQKACGFAEKHFYIDGSIDSATSGSTAQTASALLEDGSSVMVISDNGGSRGSGALQNVYGLIYIDTNGLKQPNTYGSDMFFFYLTKTNIMPAGSEFETTYKFEEHCYSKGLGCESWIILNENMDYLHCKDLSWSGSNRCK